MSAGLNNTLFVQEVSPRDGLQIETAWVETVDKIALIDQLSKAGFLRIEAGSFVSPKAIPALRDGEQVFAGINRQPGVIYVALVPNLKGAQRALQAGVDELNMVMSASQTHNLANLRMSGERSLAGFAEVVSCVRDHPVEPKLGLNASIATAFGCPFEGKVDEDRVMQIVDRSLELGIEGITLADTTGMANPRQVAHMVKRVLARVPAIDLTLHFHNTRGLGLCNVLAAFEAGARRFDASLGGLGGCPFAPGASGNICTEDLVNLCDEMGISTGIDLEHLLRLSRTLSALLRHELPGQLVKAGRNCDLHPQPAWLAEL